MTEKIDPKKLGDQVVKVLKTVSKVIKQRLKEL